MARWRHTLQNLESEKGTSRCCERKADMDMGHAIFFAHAPRALYGACRRWLAGEAERSETSPQTLLIDRCVNLYNLFLFESLLCARQEVFAKRKET